VVGVLVMEIGVEPGASDLHISVCWSSPSPTPSRHIWLQSDPEQFDILLPAYHVFLENWLMNGCRFMQQLWVW